MLNGDIQPKTSPYLNPKPNLNNPIQPTLWGILLTHDVTT